jgi:hypothetical protein
MAYASKDDHRSACQRWYQKNRERVLAKKRAWYRANPEKVRRILDAKAIKYAAKKSAERSAA